MKKVLSLVMIAALVLTASMLVFAEYEEGANVTAASVKFDFPKANTALTFDGIISDGEFYEITPAAADLSYATAGSVQDAKDMKWKAYGAWDDNGFRTAVVYTIAPNANGAGGFDCARDDATGNIWNATAIQLSASKAGVEDATERFETGYALSSATNAQLSYVWNASGISTNADYVVNEACPAKDFKVTKVGDTLVYEVFTPWSALGDVKGAVGGTFGWNLVVAGGSETYSHCHAQISAGCTGDPGKNPALFAKITMADAPVVATEAPATDAPAGDAPATPANNAKTADVTVIMTLIAAASAFGGAVVFKKSK